MSPEVYCSPGNEKAPLEPLLSRVEKVLCLNYSSVINTLPEFMQQELDESQGSPDRRRALQAGCAMEASQGYAVEYRWKEDCFP